MKHLFLYVGIALAALAAFVIIFMVTVALNNGKPPHISTAGFFLAGWTGFLLWWAIKSYRSLWRRVGFWLAIIALLCVHLPAWLIVLQRYPQWRPMWFIPFVLIEGLVFSAFVDSVFKIKGEET